MCFVSNSRSFFLGLHRSSPTELSLWRDSQAVQAYLGSGGNSRSGPPPIIAKLPSPNSWASRTAASCALSGHNQSEPKQDSNSDHHHYEEIMELKRQLVHMNQDLHLTKVNILRHPPFRSATKCELVGGLQNRQHYAM